MLTRGEEKTSEPEFGKKKLTHLDCRPYHCVGICLEDKLVHSVISVLDLGERH